MFFKSSSIYSILRKVLSIIKGRELLFTMTIISISILFIIIYIIPILHQSPNLCDSIDMYLLRKHNTFKDTYEYFTDNERQCNGSTSSTNIMTNQPVQRYVVFSSDTIHPNYISVTPMTAYIWKNVHKVQPIVFVGIDNKEQLQKLTLAQRILIKYLRKAGSKVHCVVPKYGDRLSTTLQVARLAAWSLPYVNDNDIIATTDADVWPLDPFFWKKVFYTCPTENTVNNLILDKKVFIFNGPYYNRQIAKNDTDNIAIHMLATTKYYWKEMFQPWLQKIQSNQLSSPISITYEDSNKQTKPSTALLLNELLLDGQNRIGKNIWEQEYRSMIKGTKLWGLDQLLLSESIEKTQWCPNDCYLNKYMHRLDVNEWDYIAPCHRKQLMFRKPTIKGNGNILLFNDAHLILPSIDDKKFIKMLDLWNDLVGPHNTFAIEYKTIIKYYFDDMLPQDYAEDITCENGDDEEK